MDVNYYHQGNQRDRTDDADNSLRRYSRTEKPYFESLGMSHVGPPVPRLDRRAGCAGIGSTPKAADKGGQRVIENWFEIRSLGDGGGVPRSREKTADHCATRSLWVQVTEI